MERDSFDLNLLILFDHLIREKNLTRAAKQVGLSQPAMSRGLGRLRKMFSDPLFVRSPTGVIPTRRAEELEPKVRALLAAAEDLVRPESFTASAIRRTFILGTSDFVESDLLPGVAARLAAEAPQATILVKPFGTELGAALTEGAADLGIATLSSFGPEIVTQMLFDDRFRCAVRTGHPKVSKELHLELFLELAHVLISPRGEPGGFVDTALDRIGRKRHIAIRTHSFLAAPRIVSETDLIMTGPSRVLERFAQPFGLALFDPPIELGSFRLYQGWHQRSQNDPAHAWLRQLVATEAKGSPAAGEKRDGPRAGFVRKAAGES